MRTRGFTLVELLIAMAIIGVLILMTIPGLREWSLRKQVREGMSLARVGQLGVEGIYASTGKLPADNAIANIPPSNKIVSAYVSDVKIVNGAVTVTFGNNAGTNLHGKKLTFRPAIVIEHRQVPIAWICHNVAVPKGMQLQGQNETDIETAILPVDCRGGSGS